MTQNKKSKCIFSKIFKKNRNKKNKYDLTDYLNVFLQLEDNEIKVGDVCYIFGNPGDHNSRALTTCNIKSLSYCDTTGFNQVESIEITCADTTSGSPIISSTGKIISMCTFSSGGPGINTLKSSLEKLKNNQLDIKKYD